VPDSMKTQDGVKKKITIWVNQLLKKINQIILFKS
jgi:hypothetical protein